MKTSAAFLEKVVVWTAAIKILCDHRKSGTTDDINAVATAAGSSVVKGIINHPPPTNLGYQAEDSEITLEIKMQALTLFNPAHQWSKDMANLCVRSGLRLRFH